MSPRVWRWHDEIATPMYAPALNAGIITVTMGALAMTIERTRHLAAASPGCPVHFALATRRADRARVGGCARLLLDLSAGSSVVT